MRSAACKEYVAETRMLKSPFAACFTPEAYGSVWTTGSYPGPDDVRISSSRVRGSSYSSMGAFGIAVPPTALFRRRMANGGSPNSRRIGTAMQIRTRS